MLSIGLIGLLVVFTFPDLVSGADETVIMKATVGSIISCDTPLDGADNNFGTITNLAVFRATTSSTTIGSNGSVYMWVYDSGSGVGGDPGLKGGAVDLIESPWATVTDASATISAGMEGYGIQATNTAGTMTINVRYDKAYNTTWVGALEVDAVNQQVVASSAGAVSNQQIDVHYKVSVADTTPAGLYQDTVTFSCAAS